MILSPERGTFFCPRRGKPRPKDAEVTAPGGRRRFFAHVGAGDSARPPRPKGAGNDSAPFSLRSKEKTTGGKKKTPKGDLRRNKLHIPHPAASGRSRPFRCSSYSHANRFAGFAREPPSLESPLKRPRKRQFLFLGSISSQKLRIVAMSRRRADRVVRPYALTKDAGRCGHRPLRAAQSRKVFRISYVKYSTGAHVTKRITYCAMRKPDSTVARRAFLDRLCNDNT